MAKLSDGYSIEEHYQLRVKGWGVLGQDSWREGKGKPARDASVDLYVAYKALWREWAGENPSLMRELAERALEFDGVLSDMFASGPVSQARALAELLNEGIY